MIMISQMKTFSSSARPAEKPSTGCFFSSACKQRGQRCDQTRVACWRRAPQRAGLTTRARSVWRASLRFSWFMRSSLALLLPDMMLLPSAGSSSVHPAQTRAQCVARVAVQQGRGFLPRTPSPLVAHMPAGLLCQGAVTARGVDSRSSADRGMCKQFAFSQIKMQKDSFFTLKSFRTTATVETMYMYIFRVSSFRSFFSDGMPPRRRDAPVAWDARAVAGHCGLCIVLYAPQPAPPAFRHPCAAATRLVARNDLARRWHAAPGHVPVREHLGGA